MSEQQQPAGGRIRRMPPQGDGRRYVFVARPRCPECAAIELKVSKTHRGAGGAVRRYASCLGGGHRFVVFSGPAAAPEGATLPYVEHYPARCPACQGLDLAVRKTLPAEADEAVSRYVECRGCGQRCITVHE